MLYNAPFTAATKALYSSLNGNAQVGIDWFDSAVPMTEIQTHFKGTHIPFFRFFLDCLPVKGF